MASAIPQRGLPTPATRRLPDSCVYVPSLSLTLSPRGESLNLEGTLLAWEMFPQLSRFFFPKARVLGYLGAHEVICDFDVSRRLVSRLVFRDGLCSRH